MNTTDRVYKKGLLNVLIAAGANVVADLPARLFHIIDVAGTPYSDIIHPIPYEATNRKVYIQASVAEVRQQVLIGKDEETIVASTRYRVEISNPFWKEQGANAGVKKYSYTSTAVLTGNANTDRYNVFYALATKINANASNNVEAILVSRMPYTTGATAAPAVGATLTETAGGETATVVAIEITSGTFATNDAAGFVWVHTPSATFEGGASTYSGGSLTTTAVFTDGQALLIKDDAGYYRQTTGRSGISTVNITQGFTTSVATVVVVGVYSRGIGSEMALLAPAFDNYGADITNDVDGDQYLPGLTIDTTKTYTKYIFEYDVPVDRSGLMGFPKTSTLQQVLWIDEADTVGSLADFVLTGLNGSTLVLTANQITLT